MKKALVVVDMQHDFIDGSLGTKEAEQVVPIAVEKIKEYLDKNGFIYFTLDTHDKSYMETLEGKNLPVPHCIKGTKGHELHFDIQNTIKQYKQGIDYEIIEKTTFGSMELMQNIKADEIELIGVCTDICVVSNALLLKAKYPELSICVDSNACAGVTVDSHNAALKVMELCHVNIKK